MHERASHCQRGGEPEPEKRRASRLSALTTSDLIEPIKCGPSKPTLSWFQAHRTRPADRPAVLPGVWRVLPYSRYDSAATTCGQGGGQPAIERQKDFAPSAPDCLFLDEFGIPQPRSLTWITNGVPTTERCDGSGATCIVTAIPASLGAACGACFRRLTIRGFTGVPGAGL